jgi:hypothetical protein
MGPKVFLATRTAFLQEKKHSTYCGSESNKSDMSAAHDSQSGLRYAALAVNSVLCFCVQVSSALHCTSIEAQHLSMIMDVKLLSIRSI